MAIGATLVSNGRSNDIGINDGQAGSFNNGTLMITGGTLEPEVHINDGHANISSTLMNSDEFSVTGGGARLDIAQQARLSCNLCTRRSPAQ